MCTVIGFVPWDMPSYLLQSHRGVSVVSSGQGMSEDVVKFRDEMQTGSTQAVIMGCCAAASALITVLVEKYVFLFNKKIKFLFCQDLSEHTVRAMFRRAMIKSTMGREEMVCTLREPFRLFLTPGPGAHEGWEGV